MDERLYKQFEHDLILLENMLKKENDGSKRIKLESTIEALRLIIEEKNLVNEPKSIHIPNKELLFEELYYYLENSEVLDIIRKIGTLQFKPDEQMKKLYLTIDELHEFNYEFLRSILDKKLKEELDYIYQNKRFLFHFSPFFAENYDASTIFLWYFNEPHIFLERSGNISDIANLAHETAHALEDMMNYSLNVFADKRVFSEIISVICEILSLMYAYEKDFYKEEAFKSLSIRFNDCIVRSKLCLMEAELLRMNQDNLNKITPKILRKDIIEIMTRYGFKREEIDTKYLLEPYLTKYLHYNLGFLIGIDLAIEYTKDREYTSHLFSKLIRLNWSLPYDEFLASIKNIIEPGSYLEEFKGFVNKPRK